MTNPLTQQIAIGCLGLLLIMMGSLLISRKRLNIPIGGMGCVRPIFSITLSGIGAVIFGISGVICGILVIGFVIFSFTDSGSTSLKNANLILQIIIIGGLAIGFGIGFIMQILMLLIDAVSKNTNK